MTVGKLCCALVTTLLVTMTGCGDIQDADQTQMSQAVTGCELDCPGGQVLTCASSPCSVSGMNLTCNGTVTTCPLPAAVTGIIVTPPNYTMADGLTATFSAMAYDGLGQPLPTAIIDWAVADSTAAEFQDGSALRGTISGPSVVVHGRKDGLTTLTASSGGISTTVQLDVQVRTIVLVQVFAPQTSLLVGDVVQAGASVKDNSGSIVPFPIAWTTSDATVATVSPTGLITAVSPGAATITATSAAASGTLPITVEIRPAAIIVTPPNYTMADGLTATFSAIAYDGLGHPLPTAIIDWAVADSTAAEFQDGSALRGTISGPSVVVHGRKDGLTTLTASSGGISTTVQLDVQVRTIVLVQVFAPQTS